MDNKIVGCEYGDKKNEDGKEVIVEVTVDNGEVSFGYEDSLLVVSEKYLRDILAKDK